jgi:LysM repeat protein
MTSATAPRSHGSFGTPGILSQNGRALVLGFVLAWACLPASAGAQSLQGSPESLDRQNRQAEAHGFSVLRSGEQVRAAVSAGELVPIRPTRDFDLHDVSFPYARPEVRLFLERLSAQYRSACGEKLVVTSLTRPLSHQPRNASDRSVHPTGMAVDLRRSSRAACRNWLERTLLALEREGLLEAIRERNPPHYHVAVYPRPYAQYVARITANGQGSVRTARAEVERPPATVRPAPETPGWIRHRVARGETLTAISRTYGVPVSRIQAENGVRGSRILAGQELRIPQTEGAARGSIIQHTVASGESLWSIAQTHGISVEELRRINRMASNRILPGQVLEIPTGD